METSRAGTNANTDARVKGHVTTPLLTTNTITENVNVGGAHELSQLQPQILSDILKYKTLICSRNRFVREHTSLPGERVLLSERFTEPLITRKPRDQKEREEESFQNVLRARSHHKSVLSSLFQPDHHQIRPRSVILQGNSGNGKSFVVQKTMMDWASGELYNDQFDVVFHVQCEEINCLSGETSLVEMLSYNCDLTSDQVSQILQRWPEKLLIIIDGFDKLRLTQNVHWMPFITNPHLRAGPDVTLCSLLRGQILPETFLLVTTRPTGTHTLTSLLKPPQRFTEMMGFYEKGVEEYFQKFFQNDELSRKAFERVKASETLFTSCSIPVICWNICTVMREKVSGDPTSGRETTTSIYVDFVFTLLEYHCRGLNQPVRSLLESLGRLAERGLLNQQVLMEEKTVHEVVSDPADCPFLCKFLFKRRVQQETMFSFMHLSFQEFFTALYYVCLEEDPARLISEALLSTETTVLDFNSYHDTYAVKLPRYPEVLLFVFGLVNNDVMLRLRSRGLDVHQTTRTGLKKYLIAEVQSNPSGQTALFILHCLYEVHDDDFVRDVMGGWRCINVYGMTLRRSDCWALLYCAQRCRVLQKLVAGFGLTSDKLRIFLPVLNKFRKLRLTLENILDDVEELMPVFSESKTLRSQSVYVGLFREHPIVNNIFCIILSLSPKECRFHVQLKMAAASLKTADLTFPRNFIYNVHWVKAEVLLEEGIQLLQRSRLRPGFVSINV